LCLIGVFAFLRSNESPKQLSSSSGPKQQPSNARPATSPPESVVPEIKTTDLLQGLDVSAHPHRGTWTVKDGSLVVQSWRASFEFPVALPPAYRIEATIEPLSRIDTFNLGLVVDGRP